MKNTKTQIPRKHVGKIAYCKKCKRKTNHFRGKCGCCERVGPC